MTLPLPSLILLLLLLLLVPFSLSQPLLPDIHQRLLSPHDDPLSADDIWGSLPPPYRSLWTQSNPHIPPPISLASAATRITQLLSTPIHVPISVILILPSSLPSQTRADLLRLAPGMRATSAGVSLSFTLSIAPPALVSRLAFVNKTTPAAYLPVLEPVALAHGSLNTLFVLLSAHPFSPHPYVGNSRLAILPVQRSAASAATLLASVERGALRVFAPPPLYFPVPLIRTLHVDLYAYTPSYEHRAPWVDAFAWDQFERQVREAAVHGSSVRFFSAQTNGECAACARAFRSIGTYDGRFPERAVRALNEERMPGVGWEREVVSGAGKRRRAADAFRVYVVDTAKLGRSEWLRRLERRRVWTFPGMAVVVVRSAGGGVDGLEAVLLQAVVGGVYGVAEPGLYMNETAPAGTRTRGRRPGLVLFDGVVRTLVASRVDEDLREVGAVLEGLRRYGIDAGRMLGEVEYARVVERVNLLLFRAEKARELAGVGDMAGALHVAAGGAHDVRAVRRTLGVEGGVERLREVGVRCHFSRLRREAVRASRMLERGWTRVGWVVAAAAVGVGGGYGGAAWQARGKMRGKRE